MLIHSKRKKTDGHIKIILVNEPDGTNYVHTGKIHKQYLLDKINTDPKLDSDVMGLMDKMMTEHPELAKQNIRQSIKQLSQSRAWYMKNKDKKKASNNAWASRNRDKMQETSRRWRLNKKQEKLMVIEQNRLNDEKVINDGK